MNFTNQEFNKATTILELYKKLSVKKQQKHERKRRFKQAEQEILVAAEKGNVKLAQILLKMGVNVNKRNKDGMTGFNACCKEWAFS